MDTFLNFLQWIEKYPGTGAWVQGVGTCVAAFVALIAAVIALHGSKVQAKAILAAQEKEYKERLNAAAAGLLVELDFNFRRLKVLLDKQLPPDLEFEIYRSDPSVIGRLPLNVAIEVSSAYKGMINFDRYVRKDMPISVSDHRMYVQSASIIIEELITVTLVAIRALAPFAAPDSHFLEVEELKARGDGRT